MNMQGNAKEGINDLFYIQRIKMFFFFQEVKFKWDLSIQLSLINYRWAWFTYCYFISNKIINNRTSIVVSIKHDHLVFTHFAYSTILRCFMQAFQNNIYKNKMKL